jgi:hypothetical protein
MRIIAFYASLLPATQAEKEWCVSFLIMVTERGHELRLHKNSSNYVNVLASFGVFHCMCAWLLLCFQSKCFCLFNKERDEILSVGKYSIKTCYEDVTEKKSVAKYVSFVIKACYKDVTEKNSVAKYISRSPFILSSNV